MKGANALVVGIVLMFVAAVFAPLAVGENDSLHVVLTVADRDYIEGDVVTVELRIYDQGQLTDANGANDTAQVTMTRNWDWNNHIDVPLTNEGVGIYRGSYTIGSYSVDSEDHHLYFYYRVARGNPPNQDAVEIEHHNDAVYVEVSEPEFSVDVSFEGQSMISVHPGDAIVATILAKFGSSPVGDSAFDGVVIIDPDDNEENITTTFLATGMCRATYTIPPVMSSGLYRIRAQPSIAQGAHDSAWINVNVLDVWYHKLAAVGESVSFEVCVADMNGQPVNGAMVLIRENAWTPPMSGTTNESGRVLMSMTDINGQQGVEGYVMWNGYNQSVEGAVFNPLPDGPQHNGLDIMWRGESSLMPPGTSVTIPYTAFLDRDMMSAQTIYYYVTAWGSDYGLAFADDDFQSSHVDAPYQVVAAGDVRTSAIGQFSIVFTTPATQCLLRVAFEVPQDGNGFPGNDFDPDGLYYEEWPEHEWDYRAYFYVVQQNWADNDDITLSGGEFRPGEDAVVSVSMPVINEDMTSILWGVGEYTVDDVSSDNYNPVWMSWTPGGNIITLAETEGGQFEGSFTVPAFVDADSVTIIAGYMDADTGLPSYNLKVAGRAGGGISMMLIIGIVAAIVIVLLVVIIIRR